MVEILRELGSGVCGTVYVARSGDLKYALKAVGVVPICSAPALLTRIPCIYSSIIATLFTQKIAHTGNAKELNRLSADSLPTRGCLLSFRRPLLSDAISTVKR